MEKSLFQSRFKHSTSNEAKKHSWDFQGVRFSVARAGAANFTEQADRVERRWTQHFDPTTVSRREQSQTWRGRSQEMESVLQRVVCPASRGEFAPSNSHSLVLLSLAVLGDLWRTEQTLDDCFSTVFSAPGRSLITSEGVFMQKK